MRIVAFSDTHMQHEAINMPDGDVLIFAGDMCRLGILDEIREFNAYLVSLPHPYKVVIAGNHDWPFECHALQARGLLTQVDYLQDQSLEIAGFKLYGSPWQPEFHSWAFNLPRGACLKQKWDKIPCDTDILITHAPPSMTLDKVSNQQHVGCEMLKIAVEQCIQPKLHIFGHIHESYGIQEKAGTTYINASICSDKYGLLNKPIVVDV